MAKDKEPKKMGLPGEWADVEVGYSFDNPPSLFDVENMKTERNEHGGLESGYQGRWVRMDDAVNVEDKYRRLKYRPCTDPDVKVPLATRKDGPETPWQVKANNETYELWHRPVELALREKEEMMKKAGTDIQDVNAYTGPAGESSLEYIQSGQMGNRTIRTGAYAKRGR